MEPRRPPRRHAAAAAEPPADPRRLSSWLEISESAYAHNLEFFRNLVGQEVELSAVVKSNAYGHGMELIAPLAARHGADSFCVHSLDEALRLRRAGLTQDVLIMGHVPLTRLDEVVAKGFRLVLFDRVTTRRLWETATRRGRSVRIHLKLETGTHRQGIGEDDIGWFAAFLRDRPELVLDGAYTHFANIEDTTDHGYARQQLGRFQSILEYLARSDLEPARRHAACSAATLLLPDTHFEMVRLGVSQYGLWPSKETFLSYKLEHASDDRDLLRPVLTWKARVSQVKHVPADAFVGYGCTYQTTRSSRIAVLPVGYGDGYDRRLSNQAHVLIRGRRAPVRGRVCMNLLLVDVTDIPGVELEDEAVLLGRQDEQEVTAEHLATLAGTIHYEIVARLRSDLPRILVD